MADARWAVRWHAYIDYGTIANAIMPAVNPSGALRDN